MVEDADRTAASGEDAATVDGVHFKAVTGIGRVSDKRAAGRPGEFKGEGIGVCRCPFSDDVGDEASVVLSGVALKVRPMARLRSTRCIHTSRVKPMS